MLSSYVTDSFAPTPSEVVAVVAYNNKPVTMPSLPGDKEEVYLWYYPDADQGPVKVTAHIKDDNSATMNYITFATEGGGFYFNSVVIPAGEHFISLAMVGGARQYCFARADSLGDISQPTDQVVFFDGNPCARFFLKRN